MQQQQQHVLLHVGAPKQHPLPAPARSQTDAPAAAARTTDRTRGPAAARQRRREPRLLHRRDRQAAGRAATARQDRLPRHPEMLREHRPQALVPIHQVAQRLQRRAIQPPRKPHRQRDHIGAADRDCRQSGCSPLAAPPRRARPPAAPGTTAAAAHTTAGSRPAAASGTSGARAARASDDSRSDSAARSAPRTGCGSQPRHPAPPGSGRSAASPAASGRQARRSCPRPDPLEPQHLGEQPAQQRLLRGPRRPLRMRRRQAPAQAAPPVQLAVRRQRQPSSTTIADGTM